MDLLPRWIALKETFPARELGSKDLLYQTQKLFRPKKTVEQREPGACY